MPGDTPAAASAPLKYRQDLIDSLEEISGGIRFGASNEFYLEAVFRDAEDAWAAATLARWLPGMVQLQAYPNSFASLVDAIEDLRIFADGTHVTISFHLPEDKARSVLDAQKPRVIE